MRNELLSAVLVGVVLSATVAADSVAQPATKVSSSATPKTGTRLPPGPAAGKRHKGGFLNRNLIVLGGLSIPAWALIFLAAAGAGPHPTNTTATGTN